MTTIGLKFYATLRRYAPAGRERETVPREVPPDTTVAALIEALGIPDEEELAVVVGNRIVMLDYVLQDGETVLLLPPVVGGCGQTESLTAETQRARRESRRE